MADDAEPAARTPAPRRHRRRGIGRHLCLAAGCFALTAAVLLPLLVYPRLAVLPDDPQQGQTLTASDATVLVPDASAPAGARVLQDVDVTVENFISGAPSGRSGNSVVWQIATRFNVDGRGMVTARFERISLNRHTSRPTNCCGDRIVTALEDPSGELLTHDGYLAWPFDVQKRSYRLWDVNLRRAKTAEYVGEETQHGLRTYRFRSVVPLQKVGTMDLPGALFGSTAPSVTADAQYADVQTYWIEPRTGDVVRLEDQVTQQYVHAGRTLTAFAAQLETPPPSADRLSADRQGSILLPLIRIQATLVLVPLGLLLIAAGLVLTRRSRRGAAGERATA
ncbi:DUF3068 domain-containing protein [Cryptosporangium minutisporangium]|uniref:DUF3068 domain-containing protein n=1 Tax=Cryptosporangium minutisporangium TaxID=113569 RepID=A0ABP6SSD5_9ACTN